MDRDDENPEYISLEDMMETDATDGSDANGSAPPAVNTSVVYILPAASNRSDAPPSPIVADGASPPSQELDLNSSVSNLSWLHAVNAGSLQQQQQQRQVQQQPILMHHPENRNPNLLVNPTTVAPPIASAAAAPGLPVSPVRVIEMTVPAGGLRFAAGNINYLAIPPPSRQVYITADRMTGVQQQQLQHQHQQQRMGGGGQTAAHGYIAAATSAGARVTRIIENAYSKPPYSYSCLIALALKNSRSGCLPVSEIYGFMMSQFPYFKTAPDGWKNSVRHNLSLNKCFEKIENPNSEGNAARKGCLWALNPAKVKKMDDEIAKSNKKDPSFIKKCMAHPESFETLAQGRAYRSAETRAAASSVQAAVAAAVSAGLAAAAAVSASSHGTAGAGPTSVLACRPLTTVTAAAAAPAPVRQAVQPLPPTQSVVPTPMPADDRSEPPPPTIADDGQFRPGMCPLLDMDDAFLFEELSEFDPPLPIADSSFQRDVWNEVTSGLRIPMDCVLDSMLAPLRSPSRPSDHGDTPGRIKGRLSCAAKVAADGAGGTGQCFRTCPLPAAV